MKTPSLRREETEPPMTRVTVATGEEKEKESH